MAYVARPVPPEDSRRDQRWSMGWWTHIEPAYDAILKHPFLTGIADGSLPTEAFARYATQDVHFLRDYARTLAVVGAKAPTHAGTAALARHAAGAVETELTLHATLLPELGLDSITSETPIAPTTLAYTSYLLAAAYGGGFAEGLAAVLPCYWLYQRVAVTLQERGSLDPRYARWIETYGGGEYAGLVGEVLDLVDRIGPGMGSDEQERASRNLAATARYEWMFWDAAYRGEAWPW